MGGRAVGGDRPSTPPPMGPLSPCIKDEDDEGTDTDAEVTTGPKGDPSLPLFMGDATFCGVLKRPGGVIPSAPEDKGDFLALSCSSCILWLE